MASVTAFIRVSKKRIERATVRFRLRDGRNIQLFHASELEVNPSDWDATRQEIKAKVLYDAEKRAAFNKAVADRKNMMLEIYNAASNKEGLTSELLDQEIDKRLHPDRYIVEQPRQTFFEAYEALVAKTKEQLEQIITDQAAETYPSREKVAEILNVDKSTLWRWAKRGLLVPISVGGRCRYRMSDVKRMLNCK